jgi:hypothetical protein
MERRKLDSRASVSGVHFAAMRSQHQHLHDRSIDPAVDILLTLPSLKAWGFLIHRLTLKCSVLAAIFKPFNHGIPPIDEPNSVTPQRVDLQKRTRIQT